VRRFLLLAACCAVPATLAAQSSQFGVSGLGLPGRQTSVRAMATGGGFALFDAGSSLNPASLMEQTAMGASFTGLQNFRSSTIGDRSESGRNTRFPQVMIGGPLRTIPLALAASFSTYTDRDFAIASEDVVVLRGVPVPVFDTLISLGGISDLRLAGAYRIAGWTLGAGAHVITGSTRNEVRRTFEDTSYAPLRERAEIAYSGFGLSAGLSRPLGGRLTVSALFRMDGDAMIERDSTRVGEVDLPISFGGGFRWRPSARLDIGTHVITRRWGSADADIRAFGGTGARNTVELAAGAELIRNVRRPQQRPIRLGARFATLPFPVENGAQAREIGIALGTGVRFAQDRAGLDHAGIDLSLERVWRTAAGGYSEGAWLIGIGVVVRP
jgi:hypothetical protein